MARTVDGLASQPYLRERGPASTEDLRHDLDLLLVVCDYEDVFPNEIPRLPPPRDVDFHIELYPSTSPISMAPHKMASIELQELKVKIQELLGKGFIGRALHHGALRFCCEEEG